jgi:hypothetical protein
MWFRRTSRGLAVLTMAGLSLTAVLLVAVPVLTIVNRQTTLDTLTSGTFTYGDLERFNDTSADLSRLDEVLLFVGGASFLLFVGWLYRARRDLEHLDGAQPRWGWGWTLVAWLTPVANLVVPAAVIADIAREIRPVHARTQRRLATTLVWLGWLAFVGGIGSESYLATTRVGQVTTVGLIYAYGSLDEQLDPAVKQQFTRMCAPASPALADLAAYASVALAAFAGVTIVGLVTTALRRGQPAR